MRRLALSGVAAVLGLAVGVSLWITVPGGLTSRANAQAGRGCWGSICQTSSGVVQFSQSLNPSSLISLQTTPSGLVQPGGIGIGKVSAQGLIAPGPGAVALYAVPGTSPGSCKLVTFGGGSSLPTTIPTVGLNGAVDTTGSIGSGC